MSLSFRFIGGVNAALKYELGFFAKWLRLHYEFPYPLEVKMIQRQVLKDFDGTECVLRWWQNSHGAETFKAQIAVQSFDDNLKNEGAEVAFPTVIAAIGRVLKYYDLAIHDSPIREDYAEQWGDKLLAAYVEETKPPSFRKAK